MNELGKGPCRVTWHLRPDSCPRPRACASGSPGRGAKCRVPASGAPIQEGRGGARESAFLTGSQGTQRPQAQEPHFESCDTGCELQEGSEGRVLVLNHPRCLARSGLQSVSIFRTKSKAVRACAGRDAARLSVPPGSPAKGNGERLLVSAPETGPPVQLVPQVGSPHPHPAPGADL